MDDRDYWDENRKSMFDSIRIQWLRDTPEKTSINLLQSIAAPWNGMRQEGIIYFLFSKDIEKKYRNVEMTDRSHQQKGISRSVVS